MLSQLGWRSAGSVYPVMVSSLPTPGIFIGISTVILWRIFGATAGLFAAILAQSAFITFYAMLMFIARLHRQDHTLEEAALDLSVTRTRAFRRTTLPFLKPTIVTAAVIAFLQSFENDRTPLFSIGGSHTLVAEIGARMRFGIIHMVNAIGILFIAVTIICAVIWSLLRQRERRRKAAA